MFVLRSSLFSLKPRVRRSGNLVEVTTPLLVRAMTGFALQRMVRIDSRRRSVDVFMSKVWFFRTHRRIRFDEIEHIAYSFSSTSTSWDLRGRVNDRIESFQVGFKLKASEEVIHVARYIGQGAIGDFSTWLLGDDLIDAAGTQEDDSRSFIGELGELLGVPLGPLPPAPRADSQGRSWQCSACGRKVAPKPTCLYCGSPARPHS